MRKRRKWRKAGEGVKLKPVQLAAVAGGGVKMAALANG